MEPILEKANNGLWLDNCNAPQSSHLEPKETDFTALNEEHIETGTFLQRFQCRRRPYFENFKLTNILRRSQISQLQFYERKQE